MTNWPSTSSLMTRVGSALEPSVGSETVISWFLSHVCTSWTKHKESRRQCGSSPSTRQFKSFHSVDSSGKIIYTLNVYNESCCLQMNIKFKKISHLTAFFVRMINFSSKGNKKPLKCLMKQIVYTVRRNYKIKRKKEKTTVGTFIGLCIRSVMKISVPRGALWSVFLGPLFCILSCPSSIDITIVTYKLAAWASFRRMKFTPVLN